MFALLAMLLVGVSASWAQDAVFTMGIMSTELTSADGKETLTFAGGGTQDVHEDTKITDLSENASMTLHGVNVRYIRITFGDESTTYNLKWGGDNDAKNPVSGKGSIILVSNYGSDNIKIVNNTEAGTTSTPIKKVEVFYHQQGFDNATANHTETNATKTVSDITCAANTIPLDKINIIGQYCSFSPTNGHGIMMNTSGDHYLSIKFESAMDLHELSSLVINGTNVDKNSGGVFNRAQFICNAGNFDKYNNPANINDFGDFNNSESQSYKLQACTEIRFYNDDKEGTFTIESIKLNFGGSHTKKSTPVLNNGTTAEMEVPAGESFTLSASNGYWREYTSDLSGEKPDGLISGVWAPTHEFASGLSAGDYYFGIQDNENKNCDFGVNHHSELTTIHVRVTAPLLTIGKPECNHYGERTHGDNYFDIQRLYPGDGVTIGVADNGEGRKINVPTNGGNVKFVFDNPYNLRDLVGWTISDNADLRARVSCVEFFTDANCTNRVADFWSNSGDKSGVNDSRFEGDANKIKAIRISFKNSTDAGVDGEVSYDINWMCFKFEHADRTFPTLNNGTEPEMYFYNDVDETLVLSNTPGFWREYTDDTYQTVKGGENTGLIPTNQWRSTYEFTKAQLPAGDYYFAARDGGNCALDYYHQTDIVKVHLISKTAPTDFKITYDWNTGTGNPVVGDVPVDNTDYTYKQEASIMGPGQISREGYFFAYWSTTPDGSGTRYSNNAENGEVKMVVKKNTTLYAIWNKEGFEGYFNYENRLIAQWNIDLADGARLHEPSMDGGTWNKSTSTPLADGKVKTTYTLNNAIDFGELVYGGDNAGVKIPVFAGLKFKAGAGEVKVVVTKKGNEIMNTQLVLAEGVQLQVPYVRNSYRDDDGNAQSPYGWNDRFIAKGTTWGGKTYDKDTWGVVYKDEYRPERFTAMQDCIHHINRDIVYIVAQPDIWEAMTNKCYDDDTKDLFNSGGDEDVHGLRNGEKKIWKKLNFLGNQGTPCIITFKKETTIDRIGVNRNLVYSFYTENIAANSEGAYSKPFPGLRIVGSPKGGKIADVGDTYATYGNAIAMTYGGWAHNGNEFKDGYNNKITDGWGNMTVYYGNQTSGITEGSNSYDATQFTSIDVKKVPVATDGFPVYSTETNHAYSETVNPTKTTDLVGANASKSYHDQNYGNFLLHPEDGGNQTYVENYNPWTLPCRGAYAKFEPTLPGVLNVHILQEPNQVYYIADEFGRLIKEQIFVKTGTSSTTLTNNNGHISINQKDNVKYSFDVYPGKTYYLFSNVAGMGITGFYFEPYVYRKYHQLSDAPATEYDTNGYVKVDQAEEYELARQDVGLKTAELTAGPVFTFSNQTFDYTNQTAEYHGGTTKNLNQETGAQITKDDGNGNQVPDVNTYPAQPKTPAGSYPNKDNNVNRLVYNNKAVHVILDRKFTANKWATLVLPYSMNNLQLETVFGKGTKVVLLRDVQDMSTSPNHKTTINFVYHENQDIIAGYPYMIYPAQNVDMVETNAYIDNVATDNTFNSSLSGGYTAPSIVEISAVGPNLVTYPTASNNYGGLSCFKWEASYADATENMPVGSYVMSDNNMRRVNEGNAMKAGAFKGYLKYVGDPTQANRRMIEAISFGGDIEDDATVIENLLFDAGIIGGKTNVYSINGQLIRENTDDLRGLEKGIYIVNGKKYIVK